MAPYGQEEIPELRSVFEWPHLVKNAVFLDTQCKLIPPTQVITSVTPLADRMPTAIGDFISRQVYDSQLFTVHAIRHATCCRFVHVSNGAEVKSGVSWMVCGALRSIT